MNPHITRNLNPISLTTNKTTAIVIWSIGAWLTVQFLAQIGVPEPLNIIFGLAFQWGLTKAESPLWRSRGAPKMALGAAVFDVAINSAGAWPYVKNIGATDFWLMMRDILGAPDATPTMPTFIVLATLIGAFTACAAEYFWNLPD
jgi:hypothetical protein